MGEIWDLLGPALFGGTTGLLGSMLGQVLSIWQYKEERKARQMTYDHELKLQNLQQAGRKQELEHELDIVSVSADESVRVASYKHDTNNGETSVWVNNILRLVRPVLTLLMIALTAYVAITADSDQHDLNAQIIAMTSMCFAWWFGDRGRNKKGTK